MNRSSIITSILVAFMMVIPVACGSGGGGGGGGGGNKADLLIIADFPAADVVIGQPDFTTGSEGLVNASSLSEPYGNPLLHNGVLYLSDYWTNRVLGFNQVPVVNGKTADFVIGQTDFTSAVQSTAADGASGPVTPKAQNGKLLVTMFDSSSVYIYNTIPIANGASADVIVGQNDFGIGSGSCAGNRLDGPESIFTVGGKLIVADSGNDRVLIWNTTPIVNGASADIVLGQPNLTTCNLDTDPPTASTLNYPGDVWSDGKRLVVADGDNNRVLIWNTFPTADGQPADVVLGQPDMVSNAAAVSARDLDFPYMLASNGKQLFVADYHNHRVLSWNAIPTANYTPANGVLGQPDFDCDNYDENDGDCGTFGDGTGPRGLHYPSGLLLTSNMLIVMDSSNHRALVFRE